MVVCRRTVLLGVGAGAALAACTEPRPRAAAPRVSSSVVLDGDELPRGEPGWAALRKRLSGRLLLPGQPGFDVARRPFNPLYDGRRPAAVAIAESPKDVQACVTHARDADVAIAARSGGHSYLGYCVPSEGLLVDLSGLRGVRMRSDGTAVIGAGTRLAQVYRELAAKGRCLPGGSCPTVGIGGLTLGGGIGVLTRRYGLTCDKLRSAALVTADGERLVASREEHPDLFWGLRGGGGGNLGIVTSFTFATAPAPRLTVFSLRFAPGAAPHVLNAWQDWVAGAPRELWSNLVISAGSPATCRVGGCFAGDAARLGKLLDRLVRTAGVRPTSEFAATKEYLDAMRYFAGCSQLSARQCRPKSEGGVLEREAFVASSRILRKPVRDPAAFVDVLSGHRGVDLLLDSLGGAVADVETAATAFPHRSALASVQIYASCTPRTQRGATRLVRHIRDQLAPITGQAGYVNYLDRTMPSWGEAYYGRNLGRLRTVAAAYDPDRLFDFAQNVGRA